MFSPPAYVGFLNRYTPEFAQVSNVRSIPYGAGPSPIETAPVSFAPRCGQFTVKVVFSNVATPIDFFQFDVAGSFSNINGDPLREFEHVAGTDIGRRMGYPAAPTNINAGAFTFVSSTKLPSLAKQMNFTYTVTGGGSSTYSFVFPISPSTTSLPTLQLTAGAALPANTNIVVTVIAG